MNFAKRLCADDANLIEVVEVSACKNKSDNDLINKILRDNEFEAMYRKQTEEMSANGTVGAYIRISNADLMEDGSVQGGEIKINYCDSLNIIPLSVENNSITECAFTGTNMEDGKEVHVLVMFVMNENEYVCESFFFDSNGKELKERKGHAIFGDIKPFAIMRTAEVNNLNMIGYGFPKVWNAIPNLKILDSSYTMWQRDLKKSDKIVLINDKLCEHDEDGKPVDPNEYMKSTFVQVGRNEKLPESKELWQEYNPTVRIGEVTQSIELALSMLSLSFGYGTKKYSFEQGKIVTATEYAGERQDSMQEINKQRAESKNYIVDLIKAIKWMYNTLNNDKLNVEEEITVNFDDSYVEDKKSVTDSMKEDALSFGFPKLTMRYLMKKYGFDEKEALEIMGETANADNEDERADDGFDNEPSEKDVKEQAKDIAGKTLNGAQTQSLIAIIGQFASKAITENQAINIISVAIGVTKEEAKELLKA